MRKEEERTSQGKRPKVREVWCHQDVPEAMGTYRVSKGK
ncbi:hypothetical protein E2C01_061940 [Portunus trituberculatus]|uniref:Uncharacterized protein n=1 Tax=Portunus trituberculatus TaxID=210409 RepID=A0A5B7HEL2_PORTR|nr:hypothetical protein [Portunus trituberculatus]